MSKLCLSAYLDEIRTTYNEARAEYTRLYDLLDEATAKYREARRSGNYSRQGIEKVQQEYSAKSAYLRASIEQVIQDAQASFAKTRQSADHAFGDLYRVLPEKLDMAALELLKSGILTDGELVELAGRYEGNRTMTRLIGKYAKERADTDPNNTNVAMRKLAAAVKASETIPHLEAMDSLTVWAEKGLRMDRSLSDGVAKCFDENADHIFEEYGGICKEL